MYIKLKNSRYIPCCQYDLKWSTPPSNEFEIKPNRYKIFLFWRVGYYITPRWPLQQSKSYNCWIIFRFVFLLKMATMISRQVLRLRTPLPPIALIDGKRKRKRRTWSIPWRSDFRFYMAQLPSVASLFILCKLTVGHKHKKIFVWVKPSRISCQSLSEKKIILSEMQGMYIYLWILIWKKLQHFRVG